MAKKNWYINYNESSVDINELYEACYWDPTCVSFDYNSNENKGWTHRLPAVCAAAGGGKWQGGTASGETTFYQLKPEVLTLSHKSPQKWAWLGNGTLEADRSSDSGLYTEDEVTAKCDVIDSTLEAPTGEKAWLRALGTVIGSLILSGMVSLGVMRFTVWATEYRQLLHILNRGLEPDDVDLFVVEEDGEADPGPDGNGNINFINNGGERVADQRAGRVGPGAGGRAGGRAGGGGGGGRGGHGRGGGGHPGVPRAIADLGVGGALIRTARIAAADQSASASESGSESEDGGSGGGGDGGVGVSSGGSAVGGKAKTGNGSMANHAITQEPCGAVATADASAGVPGVVANVSL